MNNWRRNNKVTLQWKPGGAGVHENKEADTLATKRTWNPFAGPESYCGSGDYVYLRGRI